MVVVKKVFFGEGSGMDGDSSTKLIAPNAYLNLMNARVGVSEYGRDGRIESILGTTQISQQVYPPYGTHFIIGSGVDDARNWILYFLCNTLGDHGIYCFDVANEITYAVLYDSQVTGGLNFSKSYRVNRNVKVVGDMLYWTDNNNEPRRMNYIAGIKTNHPTFSTDTHAYDWPMNQEVITIIRKPPNYPLTFTKKSASDVGITINTNLIKNNAFRFTWFYTYRDFEQSTIAFHSQLAPYNSTEETFDLIEIKAPFSEVIGQDVQKITLCVIYADGEKGFEIKTWDKENAIDLAEINAHNAITTQLIYYFTNNEVGAALSDATLSKPYDVVPLTSVTVENADSRLFLGDNLMGYDTPLTTSLVATVVNHPADLVWGGWWSVLVSYGGGFPHPYSWYFPYFGVDVDGTHPTGFYDLTASPLSYYVEEIVPFTFPTVPSVIDINDYTFISTDASGLQAYIAAHDAAKLGVVISSRLWGASSASFFPVFASGSATTSVPILKRDSSRKIAIVFYDKYMRQCGVVPSRSGLITVPDRTYTLVAGDSYLVQWDLSNAAALTEIPDWAYYYAVVSTKDLTRSWFVQALSNEIFYATKDSAGAYEAFTATAYSSSNAGVAIRLNILQGQGMGYTFNEGDIIDVHGVNGSTTSNIKLAVKAVEGDWVIAENYNFGALTSATVLFEIYTPRSQAASGFYYEQGLIYPINNATLSSRTYSTIEGFLSGDIYVYTPSTAYGAYLTENMSPSPTFWQNWFTNAGRRQEEDRIGQRLLETGIRWSNTYLDETRSNGLSSFDALDQKILPIEMGALQKLQVTSKVNNEQGVVMLAITYNETASLYLGEVQLVGANQNSFVAQSLGVIGTVNVLKGSFGTQHPESIIFHEGLVWWIDVNKGTFVQYSTNGLEDVSRYKQRRFFSRYCKNYLAASPGNLDNINGFHHLATMIDTFHKEVMVTLPGLIYENYATNLPSYSSVPTYATSILNRFDIYDELPKTMSLYYEENKWGNDYELMPEWSETVQNTLVAFKNGVVHICNSDAVNLNRFFGVNKPIRLCVALNEMFSADRELLNIAVEGSHAPTFTVGYSSNPNIQITDIAGEYRKLGTTYFAKFFRDRLSPNTVGSVDVKLKKGDPVVGYPLQLMLEWNVNDAIVSVDAVDIGFSVAKGTKQIIQK